MSISEKVELAPKDAEFATNHAATLEDQHKTLARLASSERSLAKLLAISVLSPIDDATVKRTDALIGEVAEALNGPKRTQSMLTSAFVDLSVSQLALIDVANSAGIDKELKNAIVTVNTDHADANVKTGKGISYRSSNPVTLAEDKNDLGPVGSHGLRHLGAAVLGAFAVGSVAGPPGALALAGLALGYGTSVAATAARRLVSDGGLAEAMTVPAQGNYLREAVGAISDIDVSEAADRLVAGKYQSQVSSGEREGIHAGTVRVPEALSVREAPAAERNTEIHGHKPDKNPAPFPDSVRRAAAAIGKSITIENDGAPATQPNQNTHQTSNARGPQNR